MRFRLRTLMILAAIVPPVLALLYYGPVVATWSGGYTLRAQIVNDTGKAIDQIAAAPMSFTIYPEELAAQPDVNPGCGSPVP